MAMASSSSATVAVDKATSDLLISPDWTMNIDICDSINSNHWQAKDVVKAVKKRLQHRNPGVQLLALTLLETMVKNCGDFVHFQIVEKNILGEMVKIVKKKTDLHVRDKILVLLDSWQEAFGGAGGKYPQFYWACEDVRRSGIDFPPRSLDAAPVFTPPLTHSTLGNALPGFGIPGGPSRRLDETMATEIEGLSLSSLESMRNVMDLLRDMLQAVGPDDHEAVKDEVIVDLVERCRSNQKKLMQMLTTTGDEEVLVQGLELNDSLQILLEKHDAIASGSAMRTLASQFRSEERDLSSPNTKPNEVNEQTPGPSTESNTMVSNITNDHVDEDDEEEEDDFTQLARRHSKSRPSSTEAINGATSGVLVPVEPYQTSSAAASSSPALEIANPYTSSMSRQEQDLIDLLSITLSTNESSTSQTIPIPVSSGTEVCPGSQGPTAYSSYVAPWAQSQQQQHSQSLQIPSPSQSQPQLHQQHPQYLQQPQIPAPSQSQPQQQQQQQQQQHPQYSQQPHMPPQSQPQQQQPHPQYSHQPRIPSPSQSQPHLHQQQPQFQHQCQPHSHPQFHPQQPQYPQYSSGYPPPPWAGTPGYATGTSQTYMADNNNNNTFSSPHGTATTSISPGQNYGTSPLIGSDGTTTNGDPFMGSGVRASAQPAAQKPFVPSYKLFEDLNVLGNADGNSKSTNGNGGPSLSSSSGQSMMNARK